MSFCALHGARALRAGARLLHGGRAQARAGRRFRDGAGDLPALRPRRWRGSSRRSSADGLEEVLEIGAGSGALAADFLLELERLGCPPRRYLILELSSDLRSRSRDTLAARAPRHLDAGGVAERAAAGVHRDRGRKRGARRDAGAPGRAPRRRNTGRVRAVRRTGARRVFRPRTGPPPIEVRRAADELSLARGRLPDGDPVRTRARSSAAWEQRSTRGGGVFLRLWLPAARVLSPAARPGHADVPLPPSRARRSVLPAGPAGHHQPHRLLGDRAARAAKRAWSCWATRTRRSSW